MVESPTHQPPRRRSRFLAWIVLVGGLALSVTGGWLVRLQVREQDQARFERVKERLLAAADHAVHTAEQALYGGRALNGVTENLPRARWAQFVESMQRFYNRGVVGLGYVERIRRDQIEDVERRVRGEGIAGFTIERRGQNAELFVVTLVEPADRNAAALGRDVGGGTTRRTAALQSMQTGEAVVTKPIDLIEGSETVRGCLLFLPVYSPGAAITTEAERESALRGWVYASLRMDYLLNNIGEAAEGQLDYEVFDGTEGTRESILFDADGRLAFDEPNWRAQTQRGTTFTASVTRKVCGRTWMVRLRTTPAFDARGSRWLVWFIFGGGVVVSLVGAGLTQWIVGGRTRALLLADRIAADARRLALVASRTANSV
jgi:CHASE1-domain containing sensor protein